MSKHSELLVTTKYRKRRGDIRLDTNRPEGQWVSSSCFVTVSENGLNKYALWFYLEGILRHCFKILNMYVYISLYLFLSTLHIYTHPYIYSHIVGSLKYKLNLLYILCPFWRVTHCHKHTVGQNGAHDEHAE